MELRSSALVPVHQIGAQRSGSDLEKEETRSTDEEMAIA